MAEFCIPKNRDAYAAILGFRYQVDWTIVRCCELPPNAHLELECGEDIDIVAGALSSADSAAERTLEQIKHLGKRLTLRSPECLAALSNCVSHRAANPEIDLRFRFCTNANIGIESPSPFVDQRAAIEVWSELQAEPAAITERTDDIARIASILRGARCPARYNAENWTAFQKHVGDVTCNRLIDLIRMFEWAVRQPVAENLTEAVRLTLREKGFAATQEEAEHLHARLFLKIMQTLSRPGRKMLDSSFIESEAALPPMRDAEKRLLAMIAADVFTIEIRLKEIEQQVLANRASVDDAHRRIDQLAAGLDTSAAVVAGAQLLFTSPPRQVDLVISRRNVVQRLADGMRIRTWLRLRGAIGAGKSQLALLVANALGHHTHWLSLRETDETTAAHLLWQFLNRLAKQPEAHDITSLVHATILCLEAPALLIIEDVPRLTAGSRLDAVLATLFHACRTQRVSLLTTSHFELTPEWATPIDADAELVPPLDLDDIGELLTLHNAPATLTNSTFIASFQRHVEGHPMLAVATIRRLANHEWNLGDESLESLPVDEHASAAIDQAIHRLLRSVDDAEARSLLYRLSLVIGSFQERTLLAAAVATPAIARPRERFSVIEGLWVDRFADRFYSVSPLIRPLSETELDPGVRKSVDESLVDELISRDHLSVIDVGNAATYFRRSGALNDAALFLLIALGKAKSLPREDIRYLLGASWFSGAIPDDVRLTIKLSIRARQTSLARRIGESILPLLDDADQLLTQGTNEDAWAKASFLLLTLYDVSTVDFPRACRHIKGLAPLATLVAKQMPISGRTVGRAMWMAVSRIRSGVDLRAWLDCLKAFDEPFLKDAFRWGPAKQGCGVAINGPWQAMHLQKPSRDAWKDMLETYVHAASVADKLELEVLWTRAICAQIIVLSEYLTDLPAAVRIADQALRQESLHPSNRFLIEDALGRQFVYRHENHNAIKTLSAAIARKIQDYPEILTRTHLELGSVLGEQDPAAAVTHAQLSVDIAKAEPTRVGEESLIISLGELGLACWFAGDVAGAFTAFDEAVERFFNADLETDNWKQLLPRLGHCVSYIAVVAATGNPPDYGEPSAPPWRREMMGWSDAMADHHDQRNFPVHIDAVFSTLSMLAVTVEQDERAAYWAQRGFDEAVRHKHLTIMGMTGHELFTALILQGQVVEALDRIRQAMRASWSTHLLRQQGRPMDSALDLTAVLGSSPNERWHGAERWAIQQGMLPLLLYLARTRLHEALAAAESVEEVGVYVSALGDQIALPLEWEAAQAFIRQAVNNTDQWDLVKRAAERWPDDSPHGLRWMGYAACTMQEDIPLDQAALLHARLAWYVERRLGSRTSVQRRIVAPFLESYWRWTLTTRRDQLQEPQRLETALMESTTASEARRAQVILNAAMRASNANIPNSQREVRKWLQGR